MWQTPTDLPDLRRASRIALDTETRDNGLLAKRGSGWPWGDGYICGISVAYRADGAIRAHYFPLRHPDSQNFDREQVIRWLRDLIASDVKIVTKNGLYDWGWLWADFGIEMPPAARLEEIDALATMVDENRRKYSLDALCTWRGFAGKYETLLLEGCAALGLIPARARKTFKPQSVLWQLPAHLVGPYAETDAIRTLELCESLNPILDRENTREAYELEIGLLPMVHKMRRRGIRVDISAAEQARDLLLHRRDAVLAQISERLAASVSMDEINGRKWLISTFDRFGIKYPLTEKGNPSFKRGKRGWMQHSEHWLPPLIAAADQLDQYGDNFLQQQILGHVENGRVYGEIHPHRSDYGGTRSLRFSYSHPPLQQMPKHDELAPLIRSVFLPEENEIWASCDYNQQEFRIVVHFAARHKLTGATAARDRYITDPSTDMHAYASELTGGAISRQDGKTFNFMTIYGAGPETTSRQIKKSLSETKALLALYNEKMSFISQLATACKNAAHRDGFFKLFNRARRHFNLWAPGGQYEEGAGPCERKEAERRMRTPGHPWYGRKLWRAETYKALNALIQSAAAIQTKEWMRACFREGVVPLLQMHDSLDLSVTSPEVAEMVARLGEEVIKLEVPMKVDIAFGRTWGDAKHTWDELHAETGHHAKEVKELPPPTQCEDPKFVNDSDNAPTETPPLEGIPEAHICIFCQCNPPDGLERTSAYNGAWLHPQCEEPFIRARMAEEGIAWQSASFAQPEPQPKHPPPPPPPGGNGRGGADGFDEFITAIDHNRSGGSKTEAERDTYAKEHADEPFSDADLRAVGYRLTRVFDYTLADGTLRYQQNRYELPPGVRPTKKRPRKKFRPHRRVNGVEVTGAGARHVLYNWPAIMRAGPGSTVFITEGEANAEALIDAGLLATTVLSHNWARECVAALTGHHLIILADHDKEGKTLAAAAQRKLAPVAASTRIVPTAHLWKYLPGAGEPNVGDDVQDWIARGGDLKRLPDICHEIPAITALLESVCASDVEIEDYNWVWPGRFALKKIGLIVGLPEEGKGLAVSDIVARITRGAPWPCNEGQAPLGNVIILSAEDDISDTIVPRLIASDADLTRVTILKMVHEADSKERMFSLVTDLNILRQKILEIGNVIMIVIDPVTAYLGVGKVDSFRATDVRAVLSPLKELAEELRVSVLGIMHFNKKIDVTNVLLRISDSLAYGAASRHVYAIVNDPDNFRRLFVKGKNNLTRYEQKTLAFGIDEREVGTDKRAGNAIRRPYILWHDEPVNITATEALQAAAESKSPSARDNAKQFLEALLDNGPVRSTEIKEAARENGIAPATLRRAAMELHVKFEKDGPLNDKGERTWQWHLPKSENEDGSN